MTLHHFFLDLPAGMTGFSEQVKKVEIGNITEIEVYYPRNLNRLVEIWFTDGETDILPTGDGILTGNGNVQHFNLKTPIRDGNLKLRGQNTDPTYSHRIDAWVVVLPETYFEGGLSGF